MTVCRVRVRPAPSSLSTIFATFATCAPLRERVTRDGRVFSTTFRGNIHLPVWFTIIILSQIRKIAARGQNHGENRAFAVMHRCFFFYYILLLLRAFISDDVLYNLPPLSFSQKSQDTFAFEAGVTYVRRKGKSLWCKIQLIRSWKFLACRYAVTSLAMVKEQINRDPVGFQVILLKFLQNIQCPFRFAELYQNNCSRRSV